jgi:hypothetical protein
MANVSIASATSAAMGVGGLLVDVAEQKQPRSEAASTPSTQDEYQTR